MCDTLKNIAPVVIDKYETEKKQNNSYHSMDSAMWICGMYGFV